MTKKQTEVNDQNAEIAAAEATATPVTPETETVQADDEAGEDDEELTAEDPVSAEDAEAANEEPVEETPVPAETAAPLMNHGTHNAAVNGLQTSPGYDPSKL